VADELGVDSFVRSRWLPAAGAAAVVIVAEALINHPPAAIGRGADTGAWLALGGAASMLVGGVLVAMRVSVAVTFGPAEAGPRRRPLRRGAKAPPPPPAASPPEPVTRPLPPDPPG
jgi:hypothetical protein